MINQESKFNGRKYECHTCEKGYSYGAIRVHWAKGHETNYKLVKSSNETVEEIKDRVLNRKAHEKKKLRSEEAIFESKFRGIKTIYKEKRADKWN